MAEVIDHVLAILPFEPPLMEAAGMSCDFVGHPVVAEPVAGPDEANAFLAAHGISADAPVVLCLPGSRRGEVTRLGPRFDEALIKEQYRGIRPAPGYPACPEHSLKPVLFDLLGRQLRDGGFLRTLAGVAIQVAGLDQAGGGGGHDAARLAQQALAGQFVQVAVRGHQADAEAVGQILDPQAALGHDGLRDQLASELRNLTGTDKFDFIANHRGMFSRLGATPEQALNGIRLVMLANDVSLRNLIPAELAKGFGFFQGKPSTAFGPVAVTPDELGDAWQEGRVHLTLQISWNGRKVGLVDAGPDMRFHFGQLIAHASKTRRLRAGSIIGSGTVSNPGTEKDGRRDWPKGYHAIADKRAFAQTIAEDIRREVEARVAPLRGRPYVVFHDAYQYMEHRFGLSAAGSISGFTPRWSMIVL